MTGPVPSRHEITRKGVVYWIPGAERVSVRRDIEYGTTGEAPLTLDVYLPPGSNPARLPAVVMAVGFSDIGARAMLGCAFKEFESFGWWARLIAASGMAAITYTTGTDPAADGRALLAYVRENAAALGVDEKRIALWACSGHGPAALSLVIDAGPLAAAALLYTYTLDLDGATRVADAARSIRFANPAAGRTVEDIPERTALFLARAGQDTTPGLNEALDLFLA
ncbi:MAG TPA: hypothetical protein VIZ69_00065, partial [Thermoanaerobaculia bacterium]